MRKRFKKGDYVLFKTRDGMGSIGRIEFAEIIKWHKDSLSYDTKSLILKQIPKIDNWSLTLFDTDIICKVTKNSAQRHSELLILTYAIYDDVFKILKMNLLEKEKMIIKNLISEEPSPKKKKAVKRKAAIKKKK